MWKNKITKTLHYILFCNYKKKTHLVTRYVVKSWALLQKFKSRCLSFLTNFTQKDMIKHGHNHLNYIVDILLLPFTTDGAVKQSESKRDTSSAICIFPTSIHIIQQMIWNSQANVKFFFFCNARTTFYSFPHPVAQISHESQVRPDITCRLLFSVRNWIQMIREFFLNLTSRTQRKRFMEYSWILELAAD